MKPEQIAASYNQIAQHWDCPEFNHANGIEQHARAKQHHPNAQFYQADICSRDILVDTQFGASLLLVPPSGV